jgi:predicted DNA-binding transcriptional regulator AlpA
MRKSLSITSSGTADVSPDRVVSTPRHLPQSLLTAFEVAAFVGCHEESVRRAYLCGQLKRRRFGVRRWRFDPSDVQDWIARGAPTRVS